MRRSKSASWSSAPPLGLLFAGFYFRGRREGVQTSRHKRRKGEWGVGQGKGTRSPSVDGPNDQMSGFDGIE